MHVITHGTLQLCITLDARAPVKAEENETMRRAYRPFSKRWAERAVASISKRNMLSNRPV